MIQATATNPLTATKTISKKREQTAQRIIVAIKDSNGFLTLAAKKARLDYSTIWRYAQQFPSVREAIREAKETVLDFTEGKLIENIRNGDNASIIFYLKTQGKGRGYVERQELTGAEGHPLRMEAHIVHFNSAEVARAVREAMRLGLDPAILGGNGHGEDAALLPASTDLQATPVSQS